LKGVEWSGVERGLQRKLEVGFFGEFWKEFILKEIIQSGL
jgi:hypothetical protein